MRHPPLAICAALALAALALGCAPKGPTFGFVNDGAGGDDDDDDGGAGEGEGELAGEGEGEVVAGEGEGELPSEGEGEGEGEAGAREMRGIWITRFAFSDEASLRGILDRSASAGFNAVFVQIRGNGDAYYDSAYEPWAKGLTGVLGRDPGWDPLGVAVEHGHALGLEVHAYFNALSAWPSNNGMPPVAEGDKQHMLTTHPEWLVVDDAGTPSSNEYYWVTPGNPDVRAHTAAVARDLLEKYDVDGIHLDRIRSPGPQYSHDDVTEAQFATAQQAQPQLAYGDFMKQQVALVVSAVYDVMLDVKPEAKLSAAVWGIHTRLPGCSTSQGANDYHQDSWAWMDQGIIDALAPMTYWSIEGGACTDWATLTDGFVAENAGRHIWMGMHALDDGAFDFAHINARVEYARTAGAQGTLVFASTYLDQGTGTSRWDPFVAGPFAEPAEVPSLTFR